MPAAPAHAAADSLRTAFRRLWRAAAVGLGAVLGLLPLVYLVPMPVWQRATLGSLALAYLAFKGYRLRRTRKILRQLRLERCFIGHSFSGGQLRQCLQRRGHLWTHSYTVRALRRLMARPLHSLLVTDKKRRHVHDEYRRALRGLRPPRFHAALPLGLLLAGGILASALGSGGAVESAWALRAGLACALVLAGTEGVWALCTRAARAAHSRLTDALADWTLARSVHDLMYEDASQAYRHTPLYRAPAWFATPAPARGPAAPGKAAPEETPPGDTRPSERHAA